MLICIKFFFSKKLILFFSRFLGGIGLRNLVRVVLLGCTGLASNVLYGI